MSTAHVRRVRVAAAALVAAAVAMAGAAWAQQPARAPSRPVDPASASQAQYLLDRERCNDPSVYQDKDACLREAAAARAARVRDETSGRSQSVDPAEYSRNEARRCDPLPPDLRADCLARVEGEGFAAGSVGGGGIFRESITREIGAQPPVVPVEIK
ncbi:MAG: hypothetical protein QM766_04905 [Burkholderiaceae bacterium]